MVKTCKYCGGSILGNECLSCSREIKSNMDKSRYYESHRNDILKCARQEGWKVAAKIWQIPRGTIPNLRRRWCDHLYDIKIHQHRLVTTKSLKKLSNNGDTFELVEALSWRTHKTFKVVFYLKEQKNGEFTKRGLVMTDNQFKLLKVLINGD